jgi:hypothetical protein
LRAHHPIENLGSYVIFSLFFRYVINAFAPTGMSPAVPPAGRYPQAA